MSLAARQADSMTIGGSGFDVRQAEELYATGWSCSRLARRFGCSTGYVAARLRRHGVTMRPTGRRLDDSVDTAEVVRLRHEGASFAEIARAVGLSVSGVRGRYLLATGQRATDLRQAVSAVAARPVPERSTGRRPVPAAP